MPKYYTIQTYGCQMNYSDSERLEGYLNALGFEKKENFENADIVILNTCSIRQKAEDRVFGQMKKLQKIKRKNSNLIIIITGCMVRKSSSRYSVKRDKLFQRIKFLDIALRTEEMPKLAKLVREISEDIKISEIKEEELQDYFQINPTYSSYKNNAQAFVPVSNGCDNFCTYCIVPFSRGREKSRSIDEILKECKDLVKKGFKEIILVGQTVNSYGLSRYDKDQKTFEYLGKKEPFVYLLEEVDKLKKKGLKRVRFTSPHPKDMSNQLIEAMASLETQMPYIHLPVQAGDDNVLKRMNRTYNVEQFREVIKKLRSEIPGISISTDIIVGFCAETKEEFENTYKFFDEMDFEHCYISQYSDRKGTVANRFMTDDISISVKKERWEKLNSLLKRKSKESLKKFKGKTVNVLVENQDEKKCLGRSEHFKTVQFESDKKILGEIVPVKIKDFKEWILLG